MSPYSNRTGVLIKISVEGTDPQQEGHVNVKTKVQEISLHLEAKQCQRSAGSQEAGWEQVLPQKEPPLLGPDPELLASRTVRSYTFNNFQ